MRPFFSVEKAYIRFLPRKGSQHAASYGQPRVQIPEAQGFWPAVLKLDGRDVYLGPHDSKASRLEYDRVVAEWLANGRSLGSSSSVCLTINEIALRYLKYADGYYRKNGKPTGTIDSIKVALRLLCRGYGRTLASDFGPLKLAAIRNQMIEADMSRRYVNDSIDRIRRMFKWAVSQELVPVTVHQALTTLTRCILTSSLP